MKKKSTELLYPSLLRRCYKIWVYDLFWLGLFSFIFLHFYTIDRVCYELDYFLMYGVELTPHGLKKLVDLILPCLSFWYFFRSIMKSINLIRFTILTSKHDKEIVDEGGFKRLYDGPEGNGKTLNTANDLVFLACKKDRDMRLRYFLKCPFADELKEDKDFAALKRSYEFYEKNADMFAPHLMANFKIIVQGRKNYPFSMEYIDQTRRLAESMAIGLTELANVFPNSLSRIPKDPKKDEFNILTKNESFSLSRQYWDAHIVGDEQRSGEVALGFRSTLSQLRTLTARRKVLEPKFLIWIEERLEERIRRKKEKTSKCLSRFYTKLNLLIEDLGFYVFSYELKDGITSATKETDKTFVISCDIPYEYDTRGKRYDYKLFDKVPT